MDPGTRPNRRARAALTAVAAVIVAAVVALTVAVIRVESGESTPNASVRGALGVGTSGLDEPAPAFTLPTLEGHDSLELSDFAGKNVILNFWRSDCTPCREEFEVLAAAYQDRTENTVVIGVSTDSIPQDARDFVHQRDAHWPQALDKNLDVAHAYRITGLPQTFFIREDGTIAWRVIGRLDHQHIEQGLRKTRA